MGAFLIQFVGAALLVTGVALWSLPMGLVAAGILVFLFGWIIDGEPVVDDYDGDVIVGSE